MLNLKNRIHSLVVSATVTAVCSCSDTSDTEAVVGKTTEALRATQVRKAEVDNYVVSEHEKLGRVIVSTETLDDGKVVDWIDKGSVHGGEITVPPAPVGVAMHDEAPNSTQKLSGPPGTVPYIRGDFSAYVSGQSNSRTVLEFKETQRAERLRRVAGLRSALSAMAPAQGNPGNPSATNDRLYGGKIHTGTNYGLQGYVNNYWNGTDNPSSPEFSFVELASYCDDSGLELVGAIYGRNPKEYGGSAVFGVEYIDSSGGNWITGGGDDGAWKQVAGNVAPGASLTNASTVGGSQFASWSSIQLVTTGGNKRWWIWHIDQWAGYVDADVASFSQLDSSACKAAWYGEAFDPDHVDNTTNPPTHDWMDADMGSGVMADFSDSNFWNHYQDEGYVRLPNYFAAVNGGSSTVPSGWGTMGPRDDDCYDVSTPTNGPSGWNPIMFFGGPGGDNAGCD